jgi:hypothetical protein
LDDDEMEFSSDGVHAAMGAVMDALVAGAESVAIEVS